MKLEKLRNHIIDIVEDLQYNVYLGTMSRYNKRPDFSEREIIIEPINLPMQNDDSCKISINLNIWIAIKRRLDEPKKIKDGDDAEWIDYMVSESQKVYDAFNNSKYIRIMQRENDIVTNYYEADNNISANSQSLIRFSLPVKIYNLV